MDNVYAMRLSEAARAAKPGGDMIDHGWSLLKELHARGFDVVPRDPINLHRHKTLNAMCNLGSEPAKPNKEGGQCICPKTEKWCERGCSLGQWCPLIPRPS